MVSPRLYKSSQAYDFFLRSLGFENSIARFLRDLKVDVPAGTRILDAGCGTGLLGLHFVERIPNSTLLSTDLQPNFLLATLAKAEKRQIDPSRIEVAVADISTPQQVTLFSRTASPRTESSNTESSNTESSNTESSNTESSNTESSNTESSNTESSNAESSNTESSDATGHSLPSSPAELDLATTIDDETFGLICVGAVVGYAKDAETSLRQLLRLLSPGGVLLNLEMSQSLTGRLVSHRYHYRNLSHERICKVMEDAGCSVTVQNLRISHLPAKLTRTAIIARRPDRN